MNASPPAISMMAVTLWLARSPDQTQSSGHAPLSGIAGQQRHRLHCGGGPRSLAQASGRRRGERRQRHLLRKAHVAQRRRRRRDGCSATKKTGRIVQIGSQRVSSLICKKAKDMISQGMLGEMMLVEGWLGRNDPTGAWEYPPPSRSVARKRLIGTHGRERSPRRHSILTSLPAGVAGRNTAQAWPAISWSTWSAA